MKKRTTIYNFVWLIILLTCVSAQSQSGENVSAEQKKKIETIISAAMSKQNIPGFSIAVVTGNKLDWAQGFGLADAENGVRAAPATVYRLASISKPITAVAAMQLVEKGKLDLDAPVQTYCPAFPEKPQKITARHLIAHLSGIRHYKPDENFNSTRHYNSIAESLDAFKSDALLQEPGTKFAYTTYGYVVLGCAVEGAANTPYADYLRENVFRPAGMQNTGTDDVYKIIPNRARGYAKTKTGELRNADLADTSNKIPGGGMVSTVEDMARFAVALQTGALLKSETFGQMQTKAKTTDGKDSPYFGFQISEQAGEKILTHSGAQQGTSTLLYIAPAKKLALVLMANMEGVGHAEIARQIIGVLTAGTAPAKN